VSYSYGSLFFASAGILLVAGIAVAVWLRGIPAAHVPTSALPAGTTSRALSVYLGLVLIGAILTSQQFATLSVYAHGELGLSEQRVGLLYTVNGLLVVLLQFPAVALIDAGGPRRALMLGPAMYAVAYFCFGLSGGFTGLALAMILLTAAEVVFAPALTDMAAHLGDRKHLGRTFGLFGLVQQLGISLGPLAGGIALDHLRDHHLAFWGVFAGAMALVGVGYAWFARRFLP